MENLILTEEEEKNTKYCQDFCPIYRAVEEYNNSNNKHTICCPTEMCKAVTDAYVLNKRDKELISKTDI